MCGIVGGLGFDWNEKRVLSFISHRGPDSQGGFSEPPLFLGHTRLSIQDLSENGNQPMYSTDGRYVIIFNGEIYNHEEVRSLIADRYDFKSTGDTETVLYAYIEYGPSFLTMLNGIFALAIYDTKEKKLFIARDQLGVKPIYLYHQEGRLLFSSELKSFLGFGIDKSLDAKAFTNYLTFLWSPGSRTPFAHVEKLLPGHYLLFDVQQPFTFNPVKYYHIPFDGHYSTATEEELTNQLEQKLLNAVRRQMLSDVPVGFFLSGGLDSSLVVAMARKLFPGKTLPCFTIDVEGWDKKREGFTDDLQYARKLAALLNVELHIVKAKNDIVTDFDKMIWHLDEPQADAAPLHVLNISKLARANGIKVLLGGTAGDDLFSGYRRHKALKFEKLLQWVPTPIQKLVILFSTMLPVSLAPVRRAKKVLAGMGKTKEQRMADYFAWLPEERVELLFSEQWRKKMAGYRATSHLVELLRDIPQERSPLNQMLYWELKTFLVDHNLNYTDKMSMAVGVETRVPFLDLELVEFACHLPPGLKMKNGETKYLLKKVAERYLPMDVIYRPKTGFGAPVRDWIINDMEKTIRERLSYDKLEKQGIFNPVEVHRLIEENKSGKVDASYSIWAILAIDSWLRQFAE